MGAESKIEWTDATWNPVRGCSRVSEGCRNCYAERQAARFCNCHPERSEGSASPAHATPIQPFHGFVHIVNGHPAWTGKVELVEKHLHDPLHWKTPRRIFVNSMSDLFHEALPDEAIDRVFAVMSFCPRHTFQILTKRPARMLEYCTKRAARMAAERANECASLHYAFPDALPNVQLGVSVEDQATADERIPLLLQTPAAVHFISYEPALGPVDFEKFMWPMCWHWDARYRTPEEAIAAGAYAERKPQALVSASRHCLDWIIAGGESGPGARPAHPRWFRDVRDQCQAAGVAFFMKQIIERGRKVPFEAWPVDLKIREFPGTSMGTRMAE